MKVDPTFRYPGELPPPKATDWPLVTLIGGMTILILLGVLFVVLKSAGWLA